MHFLDGILLLLPFVSFLVQSQSNCPEGQVQVTAKINACVPRGSGCTSPLNDRPTIECAASDAQNTIETVACVSQEMYQQMYVFHRLILISQTDYIHLEGASCHPAWTKIHHRMEDLMKTSIKSPLLVHSPVQTGKSPSVMRSQELEAKSRIQTNAYCRRLWMHTQMQGGW